MKKSFLKHIAVSLMLVSIASQVAIAQAPTFASTGMVTVSIVSNAWADDAIRVTTVEPMIANTCQYQDGYITSSGDPGRKLIHNLAAMALLSGKKVRITTDGTCVYSRPRLLAIEVYR